MARDTPWGSNSHQDIPVPGVDDHLNILIKKITIDDAQVHELNMLPAAFCIY
jgi:hypothetical protein